MVLTYSVSDVTSSPMSTQSLKQSNRWVLFGLSSGIVCGFGNFVMGTKLVHAGAMGPAYTGPLGLVLLVVYRAS